MTDKLNWNEHVNNICKKANPTHGLLGRILRACNSEVTNTAP